MSFRTREIGERERALRRQIPWRTVLGVGMIIAKPLFSLGKRFEERKKKHRRLKRAITMGAAALVALCVALFALSLLIRLSGVSLSGAVGVTGIPLGADDTGVTNILLLGQGDEKGQDLTDVVMIASIDPVNTDGITLLSLPRDLYFLHTDHAMATENGKLNALWRDNRIALFKQGIEREKLAHLSVRQLADEIGDALGLPIHHFVMMDFQAFEEAVDAMGGVEIDVPETIHDTQYPGPNYTYQTFHIDAGRRHLDGKTALKYARTRSTTSDFDRSARQQHLIRASLEQARRNGIAKKPRKILELFGILSDHVLTDLKTRQLVTLASIVRDMDRENVQSLQLNNVNGLYDEPQWKAGLLYSPPRELFDGDFVMLPVSIPEFPVTWKQVRTLTTLFFDHRELYLASPHFSVLNGGAQEGLARRMAREFTKFGFDVDTVSNVPNRKEFSESHIVYTKEMENVATFFGKAFNIDPEPMNNTWKEILGDKQSPVTIILGEDFTFTFFQDLIYNSPNKLKS